MFWRFPRDSSLRIAVEVGGFLKGLLSSFLVRLIQIQKKINIYISILGDFTYRFQSKIINKNILKIENLRLLQEKIFFLQSKIVI